MAPSTACPPAEEAGARTPPTATALPTATAPPEDAVLCGHCGRTARNGLTCIGMCVADSGY